MKTIFDILIITTLAVLVTFGFAYAFQPLFPAPTDTEGQNIKYNFENIVATMEVLIPGASSYTISPISFDTNSVVIGTLNTATGQYVKSVVIGDNSVTVNLDTTLSATAEVSLMGVTKR